jgi:hypothetical protein
MVQQRPALSTRALIVAAIVAIEGGIVFMGVMAVRGDGYASVTPVQTALVAPAPPGPALIEDGPARTFPAGLAPKLAIDIGYADLTIRTGDAGRISVALSSDRGMGPFRSHAPIAASLDDGTVRVVKTGSNGFGDDRMLTVTVPPQTAVTVTHAGDIEATGLHGATVLQAVGMGHIEVTDADLPSLRVATNNGRVKLERVDARTIDVAADGGRVEGTALTLREGRIASSDGRIALGLAANSDTTVSADTDDGRVQIGDAPASNDADAGTLRVGAGTGRLSVHTDSGNVIVRQEP